MARQAERSEPSLEELMKLRKSGMSRDEIAAYYGVTLARVKRWFRTMAMPKVPEPVKTHRNARRQKEVRRARSLDDGLTLIEKAQLVLGKRLSEDRRGYLLDGTPVRVDVLIRAAGLRLRDENS